MSTNSAIHAASGAVAGVIAIAITYPLVVVSTRAAVDSQKHHKSTYQTIIDLLNSEGIGALYGGLNSSLVGIAINNGIYYFFYERSRDLILSSRPKLSTRKGLSTLEAIIASLVAGSATTILTNPIWVVQNTLATTSHRPSPSTSSHSHSPPSHSRANRRPTTLSTISHILRKDGPSGFFRGLSPALVLVINPILQFTIFEQLKNFILNARALRGDKRTTGLGNWDMFWLGAFCKLIATSSTYPYIVLKSRLQSGRSSHHGPTTSQLGALLQIIHTEGARGLYKGLTSKLMQSVLTAALIFMGQKRIYEVVKKTLERATV